MPLGHEYGLITSDSISRRAIAAWLAVCSVFSGCTSARVKTAYDHRVDFSSYRAFSMLKPNQPVSTGEDLDPFTGLRIRQVVHAELVSKGLTPVSPAQAQLWVEVRSTLVVRSEYVPEPGYWGPYGADPYAGEIHDYATVLVTIDLIDARSNAVVWHGVAEAPSSGELSDEAIWEVVQKILDEYPPDR